MTPYYSWSDDLVVDGAIYIGKETNSLSLRLGQYEEWKKLLFDPYISFRNAYFQYRRQTRYKTGRSNNAGKNGSATEKNRTIEEDLP
jgi:ABC-type transporter lipoprotein component MlaA